MMTLTLVSGQWASVQLANRKTIQAIALLVYIAIYEKHNYCLLKNH